MAHFIHKKKREIIKLPTYIGTHNAATCYKLSLTSLSHLIVYKKAALWACKRLYYVRYLWVRMKCLIFTRLISIVTRYRYFQVIYYGYYNLTCRLKKDARDVDAYRTKEGNYNYVDCR